MSEDTSPQGEGFLSRWSRRKQELSKEQPPEQPDAQAIAKAEATPAEPEPMPELPSLESLLPGQDISAFMHPAVPQTLRNAALRKMWVMDPAIRDFVSEALDYAYDYNTPGMAPGFGPLQTSPEMIREVSEMMDRAMTHHQDEPPVQAVLVDDTEKWQDDAIAEGEVPALTTPVSTTLVLGAPQQPDELPQTQNTLNEKTSVKSGDKPRLPRRHGGALPS